MFWRWEADRMCYFDNRINILDSIMDMMEKYARNMEENVEERAQQLLEEKRKTDRLLYRLLPAWVESVVNNPVCVLKQTAIFLTLALTVCQHRWKQS